MLFEVLDRGGEKMLYHERVRVFASISETCEPTVDCVRHRTSNQQSSFEGEKSELAYKSFLLLALYDSVVKQMSCF